MAVTEAIREARPRADTIALRRRVCRRRASLKTANPAWKGR